MNATIAVSTTPDGLLVGRFGHGFPVTAIDSEGNSSLRQAEGCCGHLAKAVADCAVVICTAIGQGAAGHLAQAGVRLAIVPEGTAVAEALVTYRSGSLVQAGAPSACDHSHDHDHAADGGCGH